MYCDLKIDFEDISLNKEKTYYNHIYYNLNHNSYKMVLLFEYDDFNDAAEVSLGYLVDGKFEGSRIGECCNNMDRHKIGNRLAGSFTIYVYDFAGLIFARDELISKLLKEQQRAAEDLKYLER